MISVQEAFHAIQASRLSLPVITLPLQQSYGCFLAQPIEADRDFPPYDRVTMDGIAIAYTDWEQGLRSFPISHRQWAGAPQTSRQRPGTAIEVMTGSICPEGMDTVIRYEDLDIAETPEGQIARLQIADLQAKQNIHHQGSDQPAGKTLLQPGIQLNAPEIAVAASVGAHVVQVVQAPGVAIISTGDELVPINHAPLPHQVRRSNGVMLQAALRQMGLEGQTFHFPDDRVVIETEINRILDTHQVLILSGGVSMGKADHIPVSLERAGIRQVFHKVAQRPGKPFWFGKNEAGDRVAFALPGNPVSSFVGFHKYIQPWLSRQLGAMPVKRYAVLAEDFSFSPDLTYFLQVKASFQGDGRLLAQPFAGGGSGDFANLLQGNGLVELPADKTYFAAGECYPFIPYAEF